MEPVGLVLNDKSEEVRVKQAYRSRRTTQKEPKQATDDGGNRKRRKTVCVQRKVGNQSSGCDALNGSFGRKAAVGITRALGTWGQ
jgi:hypothetical protein